MRIDGLQSATQYNGTHATVEALLDNGRVRVLLDDPFCRSLSVKEGNVYPLHCTPGSVNWFETMKKMLRHGTTRILRPRLQIR